MSIPNSAKGDEVVPAEGTYQGTVGVFLHLREDVNLADITESNGSVRSHAVAWLALGPRRDRSPAELI